MTSDEDKSDGNEVEEEDETSEPYIRDERHRAKIAELGGEAAIVKRHYESAYFAERDTLWPHIVGLGDGYDEDAPLTQALVSHKGWWTWRADDLAPLTDDERADGWTSRGRPITWRPDDLEAGIDGIRDDGTADWRTIYHLTTWKDPDAVLEPKLYNSDAEPGEKGDGGDNPNAGYGDIEGFALWIDGDLTDHWKAHRGDLTDDQIETVEAVWGALIDEFADAYDLEPDDLAAFDSGGGMYVFGPPAATVPIAEHYDRGDREAIFGELRERFNSYAADAYERVVERVGGDAADLTDPDTGVNNMNRQTKAPLSIHKKHDILVTPLRDENGEIDYTPTLISDAHTTGDEPNWNDLLARTCDECRLLTSMDDRFVESVDALVRTLWADEVTEDEAYTGVESWEDVLDTWLEERATNRTKSAPDALADAASSGDGRDGTTLPLDETTSSLDDVQASLDKVGEEYGEEIAAETIVHRWTDQLSDAEDRSGSGKRAFVPRWAPNYNSGNANYVNTTKGVAVNTSDDYHLTLIEMALIGWGDDPWDPSERATGADWFRGYELLREHGYELPAFQPSVSDASKAKGDVGDEDIIIGRRPYDRFPVLRTEWSRPHPTVRFDEERHWKAIQGERLEEAIEATEEGKIPVFADPAGAGKTTNVQIGACACTDDDNKDEGDDEDGEGRSGKPFSILVDKHEKGHELRRDFEDPTNDLPVIEFDLHMKGAEQPIAAACMDRQTADEVDYDEPRCEHEAEGEACPRMCPVYGWSPRKLRAELKNLDPSDDPARYQQLKDKLETRAKFERIVEGTRSVLTAHRELNLSEKSWHGERCAWAKQFERVKTAERVIAVHEYQHLKSVRETEQVGERIVFVDESPRMMGNERTLTNPQLGKIESFMREAFGGDRDNPYQHAHNWHAIADFVGRIRARLDSGDELADGIDEIEPPEIRWLRSVNPQQALPGTTSPQILSGSHKVNGLSANKLADFKVAFNDRLIEEIVNDTEWSVVPFGFDQVLAAWRQALTGAIERGDVTIPLDTFGQKKTSVDEVRRAFGATISVPTSLDTCPHCGSRNVYEDNGRRVCGAWDCRWDEADGIVQEKHRGAPTSMYVWGHDHENLALEDRGIKSLSNIVLRDVNPIVLDATASPAKVAGVYGRSEDEVIVSNGVEHADGHEYEAAAAPDHYDMNAHITQLMSGAYAASTIERLDGHRKKLQRLIERVSDAYECPLLISKKSHFDDGVFDIPENAETTHWHGNRGLNKGECDAVIVLSGPRPPIDMTRRQARVLAMYRDDLREGGAEYGMRYDHDDPSARTEEPIYRSLVYEDGDGRGISVPTSAMSGIAGELFDEAVSDEIEQGVNRARPLRHLWDEDPMPILLCTNVPTELPVDEGVDDVDDMMPTGRRVFQESYGLGDGPTSLYIELGSALADGDEGALEAITVEHEGGYVEANRKALAEFARARGIATKRSESPDPSTVGKWRDDLVDAHLFTEPVNRGCHGMVVRAPLALITEIALRSQLVCEPAISNTNSQFAHQSTTAPVDTSNRERSSWESDTSGAQPAAPDGGCTIEETATATIGSSVDARTRVAPSVGADEASDPVDDDAPQGDPEHTGTDQTERLEAMGGILADALDGETVPLPGAD